MQVPFYVKSNGQRYLVVAVIVDEKPHPPPDGINIQTVQGGYNGKFMYGYGQNAGNTQSPQYMFVAAAMDQPTRMFMNLYINNCEFDGLVENCLMCGGPKVPVQEKP